MCKIAVFTNKESDICDFFDASRFLIFDKQADKWAVTGGPEFERIIPSSPVQTRKMTEALLPLLEGCHVVAGGTLVGIPYSVFDRAGLHIFQINMVDDAVLDEMVKDIQNAGAENNLKEKIIKETRPVETGTNGVFSLDLIALQSKCPEVSSKMAMKDFLENTPFMELRLTCKHIPPWIENSGKYNIQAHNSDGAVNAVITRKCQGA
jgi:hypothetical protein